MFDWWYRRSVPFKSCTKTFVVLYLFHLVSFCSYICIPSYNCKHVEIPDHDAEVTTGQIGDQVLEWLPWALLYHTFVTFVSLLPWPVLSIISISSDVKIDEAGKNALMMLVFVATDISQILTLSMTVYRSSETSLFWGVYYLLGAYSNDVPPSYVPEMFHTQMMIQRRSVGPLLWRVKEHRPLQQNFMKVFDCKFRFHAFHNFLYTSLYFFLLGDIIHKAYQSFAYTMYFLEGRKFFCFGFREKRAEGKCAETPKCPSPSAPVCD
uniref:Transmembrane protein n=1 Tax=Steinernema glaseri TaxID=37863 RepID=A0A1I7ZJP9_9BILA